MKFEKISQTTSFNRAVTRFIYQLLPGTRKTVIEEFRLGREQYKSGVVSLVKLIVIPCLLGFFLKTIVVFPTTEYFWKMQHNEIFLNSSQEQRGFLEMQEFEEILFFESLTEDLSPSLLTFYNTDQKNQQINQNFSTVLEMQDFTVNGLFTKRNPTIVSVETPLEDSKRFPNEFKEKAIELALTYKRETIESVVNCFGDCITLLTFSFLLGYMESEIRVLKSVVIEIVSNFDKTTRALILLGVTNLLVGYHSRRGWEIGLELMFRHFGLVEDKTSIYFCVAIFPVILGTTFKYIIFQYLAKLSPATIATYEKIIE